MPSVPPLPPRSVYPKMAELLKDHPSLVSLIVPRLTPYIPHDPTPKQAVFLSLPHLEAFYGGAAGGGKSDALLIAALQYVDIPGYAAIVFRKTFADLKLPDALISRSHQWLAETDAKWDNQQHQWSFPSGAILAFGYLDSELSRYRYQSAAFQFVAFDELSQFWEDEYTFLFSRLRGLACSIHKTDAYGDPIYKKDCPECNMRRIVPKRMRAASNPGGIGHTWVKDRFQIKLSNRLSKIPEKLRKRFSLEDSPIYLGQSLERPFVPSFVWDNPYLLISDYIESLQKLDPVTREQLLRGDWGITSNGRFKKSWVRYYSRRGEHLFLGRNGQGKEFTLSRCRSFMTVDPAASAREGPGDRDIWRKAPSWTVISTWVVTPNHDLIWWDMLRFRKEIPDVIQAIGETYRRHTLEYPAIRPEFVGIEANGLGVGVYQTVGRMGIPTRNLSPHSHDKLVRATDLANRMEEGKVYLPEPNSTTWLETLESELFTWTGHPAEPADQIDTGSYAAMIVSRDSAFSEPTFANQMGLDRYDDSPAAF